MFVCSSSSWVEEVVYGLESSIVRVVDLVVLVFQRILELNVAEPGEHLVSIHTRADIGSLIAPTYHVIACLVSLDEAFIY